MTTYRIETGASTRSKSRQNMTHTITAETEDDAVYEARVAHVARVGWNASIWIKSCEQVGNTLPNGCSRETAEAKLALYDARMQGGYKNQIISAREQCKLYTGMNIRELRKWLAENPTEEVNQ